MATTLETTPQRRSCWGVVYSSEQAARDRIERSLRLPGFAEHPDDFVIGLYEIDRDEWTTGYLEL